MPYADNTNCFAINCLISNYRLESVPLVSEVEHWHYIVILWKPYFSALLIAHTKLLPIVRVGREKWYQGDKRVRKIRNSGKKYFERSSTIVFKVGQ